MRGWTLSGLALVVWAIAMPGCLDAGRPPEYAPEVSTPLRSTSTLEQGPGGRATGDPGSYWFVHVTGGEEEGFVTCDRGFSYAVDVTARSLMFSPAAHPIDPSNVSGLVAYWVDRGSCPLAYGLDAGNGSQEWDLGVLGKVTIRVGPEGEALVMHDGNESRVPVGMQLRLTGEGRVQQYGQSWDSTSEVLVANHGAWPRSGLQGAADGPGW